MGTYIIRGANPNPNSNPNPNANPNPKYLTSDVVRPKALVLLGGSRLGKSQWARSLGYHSYFHGLFNIDDLKLDSKYAVFDDIDFTCFPHYKMWFGGHEDPITITGKYRAHRTITWGKPVIWVSNIDFRNLLTPNLNLDRDWVDKNCVFVEITRPLF